MQDSRKTTFLTPAFIYLVVLMIVELWTISLIGKDVFLSVQKTMLATLCVTSIVLGIRERFIINPYFCLFFFPFSLLIYDPNVSLVFLVPLIDEIYVFCACATIAFMLGVELIASRIDIRGWFVDEQLGVKHVGFETAYLRIGLLVSSLWFIYQVAKMAHVNLPGSALAVQLVYVGVVFMLRSKRRFGYFVVGFIMLFMLLTMFRKSTFLMLLFLGTLSLIDTAYISRLQMQRMIVVMIGAMFFMVFIAYPAKMYFHAHRGFKNLTTYDQLNEVIEEDSEGYGDMGGTIGTNVYVLRPYLSMTTEWTNLDYVIETQPDSSRGLFFIRPIFKILQLRTPWKELYIEPYKGTYNTFTYLCWQWKDFGYIGAVILTFFEGLLVGWSYRRFRERPNNPIETVRYVFLAVATIEMFFNNHFLLGGVHIVFLATWALMVYFKYMEPKIYFELTRTTNLDHRRKQGRLGTF